jgi:DNA processing protein
LSASGTDRSRLLTALSLTPVPVDALIVATGLAVPVIQTLLLELDLTGRIEWSSGQLVALKG